MLNETLLTPDLKLTIIVKDKKIKTLKFRSKEHKIINGPSFWRVESRKSLFNETILIRFINQAWNGTTPNLA